MAQTLPDITITGSAWVDVNTEASIPVGTHMSIIAKGIADILLYEGDTAPAVDSSAGIPLSSRHQPYAEKRVLPDSLRIWAKCVDAYATSYVSVQELL